MKETRKIIFFIFFLIFVIAFDTIGYIAIEEVTFIEALYMTIISITTVGYREVFPLSPNGILFTIWVIVSGIGIFFSIAITIVEDVLEGRIRKIFGRRKMKKFLSMKDHVVIAGFGRMGEYVCKELADKKVKFVVLENSNERFAGAEEQGINVLHGDATNEEILKLSGIDRARTFISLLPSDSDNIFTVLSAREMNPSLFIITRAVELSNEKKLFKIGADRVIMPYELGSRTIVNTVIKPNVVDFMDIVGHTPSMSLSIEECKVMENSPFAGKEIKNSRLREKYSTIILAIKREKETIFNPTPDEHILPGDILILVGEKNKLPNVT